MYLLLPFLFILFSAAGIVYLVHRKMPYLKKLTPESHQVSDNILRDFFPEVMARVNEAKFKEYQKNLLQELEKLARRFRVVTLKMDHLSHRLITSIRHRHVSTHLEHKALLEEQKPAEPEPMAPMHAEPSMESLKAREQQLIIDIAKSPKEVELYNQLGDLYLAMHNIEEAKESFEAALSLNPGDLALARKYSQLLKKTEPAA